MPENITIVLSDKHLEKLAKLVAKSGLNRETLIGRFIRRGIDRAQNKQENDLWESQKLIKKNQNSEVRS